MSEKKQLTEVMQLTIFSALSGLAQNPIAVITAVGEKTISCKPVVNKVVDGVEYEMPEFIEVPPVFMYGAQSYEAYPLSVGDYCILMISERCFDLWYDGQDFRPPAEVRTHDYSDAFALVGIKNKTGAVVIPDRITQIGDKYKEGNHEHLGDLLHTGNTDQTGDYTQEGGYNLTGNITQTGDTNQTGNTTVSGTVTGTTGVTTPGAMSAGSFTVGGTPGWSGSFATGDSRTVTVTNGIITQVI